MANTIINDRSFGVIPVYLRDNTLLFLLIRHNAGHWAFPKGHAEHGESPLQSALREFMEETGVTDFKVLSDVGITERYSFNRGGDTVSKEVIYFPILVNYMAVSVQISEIQDYRWVNYTEGIELASFPECKALIREGCKILESILNL